MKYEIQPATKDDVPRIQAMNYELFKLEQRAHVPSLDPEWVYSEKGVDYFSGRIAGEDGCVLIAVADGKAVGYLCGGLREAVAYRNIEKVAELENMFVYEAHRSKGIGAELVDVFVVWCTEQEVQCIKVNAYASNKKALEFYRKGGFVEYSVTLERILT